jgi:hypothetical protein
MIWLPAWATAGLVAAGGAARRAIGVLPRISLRRGRSAPSSDETADSTEQAPSSD